MPTERTTALCSEQHPVKAAGYAEGGSDAIRAEHPSAVDVEKAPDGILMSGGLAGHGEAAEQVIGQTEKPPRPSVVRLVGR
jgi:hypothetical protein